MPISIPYSIIFFHENFREIDFTEILDSGMHFQILKKGRKKLGGLFLKETCANLCLKNMIKKYYYNLYRYMKRF